MTQEQKDKLKQAAAEKYPISGGLVANSIKRNAFKAGAQTILDNPQEWGLQDIEDSDERWCEIVDSFRQEADRYRRALDEISNTETSGYEFEGLIDIAKEALKQQEDETDNTGD